MNIQNLVLDINKKCNQLVTANVGEVNSRLLKISVIDNGVPMDLTDITVYLYAKKPDNTKVFNSATVKDAKQGIILAQITSQVLAIEGYIKLTLLLTKDKARLASKIFTLKVDETIVDDEALESSNEFKALDSALDKVDGWNGYFEETSGKIEEKYTERLNQVDSQLATMENISIYSYISNYEKYEGETYDTERLQRALDDCSVSGKTLIINQDLYLHLKHTGTRACSILMPSNVIIQGINKSRIKLVSGTSGWCRMFNFLDSENIIMKDLVFDGNRYNVTDHEQMHIMFVQGAKNVTFERCEFFQSRGDGILLRFGTLDYCFNIKIYDCIFDSCGRNGITFGSGFKFVTVKGCEFKGNTFAQHIDWEPDYANPCEGVIISGNSLDGTEGGSMFTLMTRVNSESSDIIVVENNIFVNVEFFLNGCYNARITNNSIIFNKEYDLYSYPIAIRGDVYNIQLNNNTIYIPYRYNDYAISINNLSNINNVPREITLDNNTITTLGNAISIQNSRDIKVINNKIKCIDDYSATSTSNTALRIRPNTNNDMKNILVQNNMVENYNTFIDCQPSLGYSLSNLIVLNNILDSIKSYGFYSVNTSLNSVYNFVYSNNVAINQGEAFVHCRPATTGFYYKTCSGATEIIYCQGSPEGRFTGNIGSMCIDLKSGELYLKQSASTSNTGWILK